MTSSSIFGGKMKISTTIKVGLYLSRLILNLTIIWLTSTWGVRKARKAFEKELIRSGMPKEAAKKLAKKYPSVKDIVTREVWNSMRRF